MKTLLGILIGCVLLWCAAPALAAPQVLPSSLSPADGATNVDPAVVKTIWAQFNDDRMDKDSLKDRITVDNGADYSVSLASDKNNGGDWLKITLNKDLKYSTVYTVTIDYRVKNKDGIKLGANYSWSFTTKAKPSTDTTRPTVLSTFPTSSATDVPVNSDISITFSEVMDPLSITSSSVSVSDSSGAVSGALSIDSANKVVTFNPTANLSSDTSYTVTVTTSVRDTAGNTLAANYTFTFRTLKPDNIAPTVVSVTPVAGGTGVATGATVTATFSEAISAGTLSTSSFSVNGVTGTVSYNPSTWTATFTPSGPLLAATTYTVTISTAVQDLSGNALAQAKIWSFTTAGTTPLPSLNDYCQIPPYVMNDGTGIKPNLLLIVDNSGSMYEFAYKAPGLGSGSSSHDNSYDPAFAYFGYFDSARMYKYSGSYFEPDAAAAVNKTSFWSGNFLNWLTMRRVDILRKVLVGGKAVSRSGTSPNFLLAAEDPSRDFYKTYNNVKYTVRAGTATEVINDTTNNQTYNVKIYIGDRPPSDGLIPGYRDKINFGLMFFNDGYRYESQTNSVKDGGYVAVDLGSTGANLITQIENTDPSTYTPLAETLFEAARYFEAADSAYNGGSYATKDPIAYPCQKNFVMVLTDGESTMDLNLPGGSTNLAGKVTDTSLDVSTWMDSIASQEGTASQQAASANSMDGSYYLEGVAYWAHNTDLRSSTLGKNAIAGKQNITVYTVFAFDDSPIGRDILKKTAKYGGYDDYDGTGRPDKQRKWDKNNDGIPDTYFEAQSGSVLAESLQSAFNDILARVSSGTAASILSNSEGSGANVLQALFYPKRFFNGQTSAEWVGELHNLWYYVDPFISNSNMREDTGYVSGDHSLNLGTDRVIKYRYNTSLDRTTARRFTDTGKVGLPDVDSNGDGVLDSYTFVDEVDADSVASIWRAGRQLWERTTPRTIYTQTAGTLTSFTGLDTSLASTRSLLQAANQTEADKLIAYVAGTDKAGYRNRTVKIGATTGVWRLGDIVASTPRLQSSQKLNSYDLPSPEGYGDHTYGGFVNNSAYADRGMVYVGANDGMLHAFKLGALDVSSSGDRRARLSGSGLGEEQWAFIPRNVLPYLTYYADPAYQHLYFVDGGTTLNDVSIGKPAACTGDYWNCEKVAVSQDPTSAAGSNWRTVLIGSMGLGGASKIKGAACKGVSCVETPTLDPLDNAKGLGYSSYFALDVTTPGSPSLLWEFGHENLGFSTAGAAVVKIAARKADNVTPDRTKNGKWFAVLASGPTGPIDSATHQFKGTSNQNLTIYVLNLHDGTVAAVIDTLEGGGKIANAFAGSITNSGSDTDRWDKTKSGHYQDDAVYIGYTQLSGTTWTGGGVLRLLTGEDPDPRNWKLSKVIDGIGPVTTNVARLQDRSNHNLWLYFGSGRYYYNQDDNGGQRRLYGVREPCYTSVDRIIPTCTTGTSLSNLTDQSTSISASISNQGWYINLAPEDTAASFGAERLVTDPVALTNGAVFFTTFMPTSDPCGYGGKSHLWGVRYNTGGAASAAALKGKALVQVSTGSFEEVDTATALTAQGGRKQLNGMTGKPPGDPPPVVSPANNKPVKRILHIKEH